MRYLILCSLLGVMFTACRKQEIERSEVRYQRLLMQGLKDSLSSTDFQALQLDSAKYSRVDSAGLYFVRVPFHNKPADQDFVLVQTNKEGCVMAGRIVHLRGTIIPHQPHEPISFNGEIVLQSLNRQTMVRSAIKDGYILAFEKQTAEHRAPPMHPSDGSLPAVVVIGYLQSDAVSYSTWLALTSLITLSSSWNSYAYYDPVNTSYSYTGSGGGGAGGGGGGSGGAIAVNFENQYSNPAIDLDKYLACFNAVPDAAATCTIEIFADIPVDKDAWKLLDWRNGAPGHTFIQLKKVNGAQTAQQAIGFYPASQWKASLTNAPVAGKLVDNGDHEFNASYKMSITPEQLRRILIQMQYLRNTRYDLDEFNCTDYALELFNYVRSHPLDIPRYHIPGGMNALGTATPQGLYQKLKQIKEGGGPEAGKVTIDFYKGWVGASKGPCN